MKKETSEKGNRQAKQQKKDERGQRNEKSKGVGNVRLIKGRNLPEEEGGMECGSFEALGKSGMLQKEGRIWNLPIKGQETRRRRRKVLQKSWGMKKKEREG